MQQGVFRGWLAAGEAICFGVDSLAVPYIKEAAVIFAFLAAGVLVLGYLALFHITETEYFTGEDGVVIPKHILEEHALKGVNGSENQDSSLGTAQKTISEVKVE